MASNSKAAPPLWKLVARAIPIIQAERDCVQRSFVELDGRVTNTDAAKQLRRYDRWLKGARAELLRTPNTLQPL